MTQYCALQVNFIGVAFFMGCVMIIFHVVEQKLQNVFNVGGQLTTWVLEDQLESVKRRLFLFVWGIALQMSEYAMHNNLFQLWHLKAGREFSKAKSRGTAIQLLAVLNDVVQQQTYELSFLEFDFVDEVWPLSNKRVHDFDE